MKKHHIVFHGILSIIFGIAWVVSLIAVTLHGLVPIVPIIFAIGLGWNLGETIYWSSRNREYDG